MSVRAKIKKKYIESISVYECQECKISQWRGEKLTLHLDHINGINDDNRKENLRLLCPNCHSLTHTYCGKNNKLKFHVDNKKVSDDVLLRSMKESKNVKECLNNVGLSGADNYKRVYRLAEKNNILHLMEPKNKNKIIVQKLKDSNIDYSTFGWVEKASKIIGIKVQKTRAWIARNCPEILEKAFIRKI